MNCPLCASSDTSHYIKTKDHFLTHEEFDLSLCNNCQLVFTINAPVQNEIGKYYQSEDYISHSDSKAGLINRLYHLARNFMLKSKAGLVLKTVNLKKAKLLDIGSGTGYFLDTMVKQGWEVQGIEEDTQARYYSIEKFGLDVKPSHKLFELNNDQYQAITLWHVLEHLHELPKYLTKITSLLQSQATLFVAVPNYQSTDAKHYKSNWAAFDVPRHLYHYSADTMIYIAENYGFELVRKKIMLFDPIYISMISEKYKNGSSIVGLLKGLYFSTRSLFKPSSCSSLIYVFRKK